MTRSRSTLFHRLAVIAALAASMAACGSMASERPAPQSDPLVVAAPAGTVRGRAEGDIRAFKGIPYAAPPVGEGRWRPPVPLAPWTGVRNAAQFGPACIQPTPGPPHI